MLSHHKSLADLLHRAEAVLNELAREPCSKEHRTVFAVLSGQIRLTIALAEHCRRLTTEPVADEAMR